MVDSTFPDNAWRFGVFSRAALEYSRLPRQRPPIIHAHDWQTGMVPVFQKMQFSTDPVLAACPSCSRFITWRSRVCFRPRSLPRSASAGRSSTSSALEYWGQISYLKGGINFSERITTVSPTYAREILTPELGFGLDGVLLQRADELSGILNGIDVDAVEPGGRSALDRARFSADDCRERRAPNGCCSRRVGLPVDAAALARPVIGVISRLTHQKGLDLFAAAADDLMSLDASWVMLGSGERRYEDLWRTLAARFPERVVGHDRLRRAARAPDRGWRRPVPDALAV